MTSEVTYAEITFKNATSLPAETKAPPEKSTPQSLPWKPTHWLPWLVSALLLLLCISLFIALVVILLKGNPNCEKHTALSQNYTEWHCIVGRAEGKGQAWTCCPMGWELFHTSCYYFSKDFMKWNESEKNCTEMGSHLVVINTETEQAFLSNWKVQKGTRTGILAENYFIGLTQQEEKGQWRWVDQTPYNKTAAFWKDLEPNNLHHEKCVVMDIRGNPYSQRIRNWNNLNCDLPTYRICETAATNV